MKSNAHNTGSDAPNVFQALDRAMVDFITRYGVPPDTVYLGSRQYSELRYLAAREFPTWAKQFYSTPQYRGCQILRVLCEDHLVFARQSP